ncbi:MAG: DUF1015 domain-containing protein [Actinomycetota bacterium]|nr:DUF1015 domain-containing protein [Actinomycetota bacterium]
MAVVQPFRALRYDERRTGPLADLVAPPYDVITAVERGRYLERSPYNVARLIVPETPAEAGELFRAWRRDRVLVEEAEPALWWLREEYEGPDGERHSREGFFGTVDLEPYERGVVLPHERTYEEAKRSQLELLRAVRANLSPIMLLYDDPEHRPRHVLAPLATGDPVLEASDAFCTTRLWRITDAQAIEEVRRALAELSLVIADGHHRYETALRFHEEDRSPSSRAMMAVFSNTMGEGLVIFPTHRVVRELPDLNGRFSVTPVDGGAHEALRRLERVERGHPAFVVYRAGRAAIVEAPGERQLDTVALERLGIESVRFTPRTDEAMGLVDAGEAAAAFLLRAPTLEQVRTVAEAGQTMPQKSTYFYPKLLSGLLFHAV